MANFKRHKTKRNVRCTMCTQYRWMGNGKDRTRFKAASRRISADAQVEEFAIAGALSNSK
jgi:hypothetical protein